MIGGEDSLHQSAFLCGNDCTRHVSHGDHRISSQETEGSSKKRSLPSSLAPSFARFSTSSPVFLSLSLFPFPPLLLSCLTSRRLSSSPPCALSCFR